MVLSAVTPEPSPGAQKEGVRSICRGEGNIRTLQYLHSHLTTTGSFPASWKKFSGQLYRRISCVFPATPSDRGRRQENLHLPLPSKDVQPGNPTSFFRQGFLLFCYPAKDRALLQLLPKNSNTVKWHLNSSSNRRDDPLKLLFPPCPAVNL